MYSDSQREFFGFTAPFGKAPEQRIFLSNPSDDAVAFKIRTTAPKRYCVRPNIGIVPAKDKIEIQGTVHEIFKPLESSISATNSCGQGQEAQFRDGSA
jgi:hypothetical protein